MLGLDAILSNPAIVRMAAQSAGIEAARLDVDPKTHELIASVRIRGQVAQHKIPTGRAFTIEQILTLLFPGPGQAARPAAAPERVHLHAEIETTIGKSPP
jgi:hypothetical protein